METRIKKVMQQETFRTRYLVKVLSSIIIAVLNIVIQMILPRAFSVEEFGYYSYNLNIFTSIVILGNLSTSNALVAKFSKRNEDIGLVFFYLKFYFVEIILLSACVSLLFSLHILVDTFSGQTMMMVMLGLETTALTKFFGDIVSMYDSMAITKTTAVSQIILKILSCLYVVIFYIFCNLNLIVFYIGQIIILSVVSVMMLFKILRYQKILFPDRRKTKNTKAYIHEYSVYCKPLIASNVFAQIITVLMNWCLMRFSGATEQAMFGVAWQLNTLVMYVFTPYAELSKREYSIISNDEVSLRGFYEHSLYRVIWLTAYFACYIGFCSDWIVKIIYGNSYVGAKYVVLLIMIYTIYQAWGQMSGSFMLATERTKMNAWLGIIGQIINVALVFLFQIPNVIWPHGLGALGIALVYVLGNVICVSLSIIVTVKSLNMKVLKIALSQIPPIMICGISAIIISNLLDMLIENMSVIHLVVKLMMAGIGYSVLVVMVLWIHPAFIGTRREELLECIANVLKKIKHH